MRQTLIGAALAFGRLDILAQIEASSEEQLPSFISQLMQAGGAQLQAIGGELSAKGYAIEGAKTQAEGKFYATY